MNEETFIKLLASGLKLKFGDNANIQTDELNNRVMVHIKNSDDVFDITFEKE